MEQTTQKKSLQFTSNKFGNESLNKNDDAAMDKTPKWNKERPVGSSI